MCSTLPISLYNVRITLDRIDGVSGGGDPIQEPSSGRWFAFKLPDWKHVAIIKGTNFKKSPYCTHA